MPLFEPPIDPALLVQAAAAGVDLSSALSDLNAPLPAYRFQVMLQRAVELCADVRSLGAALLSALERQDAEELAAAPGDARDPDAGRICERSGKGRSRRPSEALEALERSRGQVEARRQYYATPRRRRSELDEQTQVKLLEDANRINRNASREETGGDHLVRRSRRSSGPSRPRPSSAASTSGQAAQAIARWHGTTGAVEEPRGRPRRARRAGTRAARQEWRFQRRRRSRSSQQLDTQIAAAARPPGHRRARARRNHDAQTRTRRRSATS